jgi:hypothetical protein
MSYIQAFLRPRVMSHHPVQGLKPITSDEHPISQQSFTPETNHLNNEDVIMRMFHFR